MSEASENFWVDITPAQMVRMMSAISLLANRADWTESTMLNCLRAADTFERVAREYYGGEGA